MKKTLLIVLLVFVVMFLVSCSNGTEKAEDVDNTTAVSSSVGNSESNSSNVSAKNETVNNTETKNSANEDSAENEETATTQRKTTESNDGDTQKATKSNNTTTTTKKSASAKETTTKKTTTTKKQTTTQKQTTTKKPTTTQKTTTTKKSGLSKSDVEWVQSQAHAYIKSKGISVDSSVQSFSYRTSSHNYTSKNDLLNTIKETIDFEYSECMSSGWNKVSMYVSISSDGNGDYWLIVKYG